MKFCLRVFLGAMIAVAGVSTANADVFIAGVNGSMSVGGTTTTIEGDQFGVGGSSARWDGEGAVGTDFVATSNSVSADRYMQVNGTNITGLNLTVADNRYVEVFYSLGADFTAAGAADVDDHRFFLSDTGQGNNGENPQDTSLVDATAGTHSFVLDLLSTDGTTLDGDFDGAQTWDQFRWDMWNNVGNITANSGIQVTLDKIVYGNTLVAVPEPSSIALIAMGGAGMLLRRRKRMA